MPNEAERFVVPAEAAGSRLDAWLAGVTDLTRSALQQLMEKGAVRCNGRTVSKSLRVAAGDTVELERPEPVEIAVIPQDIPLDVVYEDDFLLVINKPKGMVVHPAPGNPDGTLVNALLWHCRGQLSGINGEIRPGIVHRIDKDTSGLLVVAKTNEAHTGLAAQLEGHHIARVYNAVCYGGFSVEEGTVDSPIARDPADRKKMKAGMKDGRNAVTHYRVLSQSGGFSWIECRLETGRTHQIRVHMASIGHPLAGDSVYGPRRVITELAGQCLHAAELSFTHPITGQHMNFHAPLPDYFTAFVRKCGLLQEAAQ
ncbi:MAG: RluA family pseudouridine synthase [Oscillospiraceae bacterium]|nr:RluA family pseudouridine synthase [Oscillospiraceae bacterium]